MNSKKISLIIKEGEINLIRGGDTKNTFLLIHRNNKYILRKFQTERDAIYYLRICKIMERYKILPKVYGRRGREVLFEYISGRDCNKKDAPVVAEKVGKICGYKNKIRIRAVYNPDTRFNSYIATLKKEGLLDKEKEVKIKDMYFSLKKKLHPKIKLDANDVYPQNFRLRNGKVYLVDIEAIKPLYQGHGIAKSFIRWFKEEEQREKLKRGYFSVMQVNLFKEDYLQFLYLNFFVRSIAIKLILKIEVNPKDIKKLYKLLKEY